MSNGNNYSIDILVNGNSCKQYNHDGKIFIEAKEGSEYEIKINNNQWHRILAVSAVDGLNVLTGETASEQDSGYVINGYDSMRIKGFRYSDEKVGAFKFTSKGKSYTNDKGMANNVGVIGVRLFGEKYNTYRQIISTYPAKNTYTSPTIWDTTFTHDSGITDKHNFYLQNNMTFSSGASNSVLRSANNSLSARGISDATYCCVDYSAEISAKGLDMGTGWGQVKESKVTTVDFEKGDLTFSFDIYYASRESLLEMGVPLIKETKVSFPPSFPKKYATPPKGWGY
jgi:hypothetical protein